MLSSSFPRAEDIRKEFERFGDVRDVYIPRDFHTRYVFVVISVIVTCCWICYVLPCEVRLTLLSVCVA